MIHRHSCIVCGSEDLHKVLDLGMMPSSNNLVEKSQLKSVKSYPLVYYICTNCSMFQLLDIADREELFDNYLYMTGVNKELVKHFEEMIIDEVVKPGNGNGFGVVVGSNDGSEVKLLKETGGFKRAIGVDPAKNLAIIANENGIYTINDFFTERLGQKIVSEFGKADFVTANNVFAHIPDPSDMLKGMKVLIKDTGFIIIEVHWLKSIVEKLEFETLYTEHYYVWSVKSMDKLSEKCGLNMVDVKYMPKQHGGSLRFKFMLSGKNDLRLESDEEKAGLYDMKMMTDLQSRANRRKEEFMKLVNKLKNNGKRIAIWSVPAKVPTLLNFCGITSKEIDCAYEIVPSKIGRYIPKAGIEVKDEKLINSDKPDYLIIGAWNYMDFAKEKLKWYTAQGGKLIDPLSGKVLE